MGIKITVFTPTYNRAYIIENLYRSLQRQTCYDFEWLIVDDGSEDGTKEIVQTWIKDNNEFPIRYYYQFNSGKCRAINSALDLANGELFLTVDSDDYLTETAIEKIIQWESLLPKGCTYCGISGNLGTQRSKSTNTLFTGDYYEGTLLDRYKNVDGERAIAFYTDIHRKYKYPVFEGETFMTEAVSWNRMAADGYKTRFYNDIICVYEYQEDGLTKAGQSLFLNNPKGYGIWLKEKAAFMNFSLLEKLKMYYTFSCDLIEKYSVKIIADCIGIPVMLVKAFFSLHKLVVWLREKSRFILKRRPNG